MLIYFCSGFLFGYISQESYFSDPEHVCNLLDEIYVKNYFDADGNLIELISMDLDWNKDVSIVEQCTFWYHVVNNYIWYIIFWIIQNYYPNGIELFDFTSMNSCMEETFNPLDLFYIWLQVFFFGIITIWARGVGPRFRPDQLSDLTWKDLVIYLLGIVLVVLFIILLA